MFKRGINITIAITLFFISFYSLVTATNTTFASTSPVMLKANPANNNQHVPVITDITLYFNNKVKNIHIEKIKFFKKHTNGTYYEEPIKEIKYDEDIVTIIPENKLEFNRTYKYELASYTVELNNGYVPSRIVHTFQTNYMEFYELMVLDGAKLERLLTTYTPRDILVTAPDRYIENIHVAHKKKGKVSETASQPVTESLTNVDILTELGKVSRVKIEVIGNGKVLRTTYAEKITKPTDSHDTFTLGFGNLPVNFDVKIIAFDHTLRSLDQKIVKVVATEAMFSEVKEKYQYQTEGKTFSLYDLLTKSQDFNTLLLENDMKKLMVQVR